MNKVIYKYELEKSLNNIELPKGYEILSVIEQNDKIILYALVDEKHDTEDDIELDSVQFIVIGTGWSIEGDIVDDLEFIDTVSTFGGSLIWHVFKNNGERVGV